MASVYTTCHIDERSSDPRRTYLSPPPIQSAENTFLSHINEILRELNVLCYGESYRAKVQPIDIQDELDSLHDRATTDLLSMNSKSSLHSYINFFSDLVPDELGYREAADKTASQETSYADKLTSFVECVNASPTSLWLQLSQSPMYYSSALQTMILCMEQLFISW